MFVKFSNVLASDGLSPNDCFSFHGFQLAALQVGVPAVPVSPA